MIRRSLGALLLASAALAVSGCATGTIYRRGPQAPQIQMREPATQGFELRRGERIKVTCRDGSIVRGRIVGLASAPESLLLVAVPVPEYTEEPETLEVRVREVETLWVSDRSEREVGGVLFVTMIVALLGGFAYALHGLSGLN